MEQIPQTPQPSNSNIVPDSQLPTILVSPKKTIVNLKDLKGKKLFNEFNNESYNLDSDVDSDASTIILEPSKEELTKTEALKAYMELPFETKMELIKRKINGDNDMYNERVKETRQMNFGLPKKYKGSEGGRHSKKRNKRSKKRNKKSKKRKSKKNKRR